MRFSIYPMIAVIAVWNSPGPAQEEDGLYKGPAFEAFKRSHPVRAYYGHNPDWMRDRQKEVDEWIAGLDAESLQAQVPSQVDAPGCTCPSCEKNDKWTLDLDQPDKLVCGECETAYPNGEYRENRDEVSWSWFNKPVTVRYYEAANGKRYYFTSRLERLKYDRIKDWFFKLTVACKIERKPEYARVARDVLFLLARQSDRFLCAAGGGWGGSRKEGYEDLIVWPPDRDPAEPQARFLPHFNPQSGVDYATNFICWGLPKQHNPYYPFLDAYDWTYADDCYDESVVVDGKRTTYRRVIDEQFFGRISQYDRAVTETFGREPHAYASTGNIISQYQTPGYIARVTGRMDHLEPYLELWTKRAVDSWRASYDHHSFEASGYHHVWWGGYMLAINEFLQMDYPPQVKPIQQEILRSDVFRKLGTVTNTPRLPHGQWPSWNDGGGGEVNAHSALPFSRNRLLPGVGYAVLGDGEGAPEDQVQVHLDFSNPGNHAHKDSLTLTLTAYGHQLLSDQGCYYGGEFFGFGHSTINHGTVCIDGHDQRAQRGESGGDLELFVNLPGIKAVQANCSGLAYSYPNGRYVRTAILNTIDLAHPYVVDVFEVRGGQRHDYSLFTGYSETPVEDFFLTASADLPLHELPEKYPLKEDGPFYWGIKNVSQATLDRDTTLTFTAKDAGRPCLNTHVAKDADTELLIGESPYIPYLWKFGHDGAKAMEAFKKDEGVPYSAHVLLRRKSDKNDLRSVFVAVHEPLRDSGTESTIEGFQWKNLGRFVGVTVSMKDGRVDTYILCNDRVHQVLYPERKSFGGVETDGQLAVVSREGDAVDRWLVGGTVVREKGQELASTAPELRGRLRGVTSRYRGADHDSLLTEAPLPEGYAAAGRWVLVEFFGPELTRRWTSAFEVIRVEREGLLRRVHVKQDPALHENENCLQEFYYPNRSAAYADVVLTTQVCTVPQVDIPDVPGYADQWGKELDQVDVPFDETIRVPLRTTHPDCPILVSTDGSEPQAKDRLDGAEIELKQTSTLRVRADYAGGVMASRSSKPQRYLAKLPAAQVEGTTLKPGLRRHLYYQPDFATKPFDLSESQISERGRSQAFELPLMRRNHAAAFDGYLDAPSEGRYTFTLHALSTALLYLDGELIVNGFGDVVEGLGCNGWQVRSGTVYLAKGKHRIRVIFSSAKAVPGSLRVFWSGPGFEQEPIPARVLSAPEG